MLRQTSRNRYAVVLLMGLAASASCQRQAPADETNTPSSATGSTQPFQINEVRIGNEASAKGAVSSGPLTVTDAIVVSLISTGTAKDAEVEATLFNLSNGEVAGTKTKVISTQIPATEALTFSPEGRWEASRYLLEVKIDGKLAEQRDIDIVDVAVDTPKNDLPQSPGS